MIGELLLKSGAVLLIGWGVAKLGKQQSAAWRHMVWRCCFAVLLVLPFIGQVVSWEIPAPALPQANAPIAAEPTPPLAERKPPSEPCCEMTRTVSEPPSSEPTAPIDLAQILAWIWGVGFTLFACRIALGLWSLRRLRGTSYSVLGLVRRSVSPRPLSAMAFGMIRPIVLLPRDSRNWSPSRRRMVVLHELAHVRRGDFATNMAAELACALYWFNPLVWLGARAMRAEAESAADNEVLASGVRPSDYASELLRMSAGLAKRPGQFALVGASPMVQPKIESRLARILSPSDRRKGVTTIAALAVLGTMLVIAPIVAGARMTSRERPKEDVKVAQARLKAVALATIMYAQDYDDKEPWAKSTSAAETLMLPYARNDKSIFESPTKGGRFLYNTKLSGKELSRIKNPASTELWKESLPNPLDEFVIAYADGHIMTIHRTKAAPGSGAIYNYKVDLSDVVTSPGMGSATPAVPSKAHPVAILAAPLAKSNEGKLSLVRHLLLGRQPIVGNEGMPIKVLAFIDYECPSCRQADKVVQEALRSSGRCALYCTPFPLPSHPLAKPAALLAESSRRSGKFIPVHNALMAGDKLTQERINEVARRFKVDPKPRKPQPPSVNFSFSLGRLLNVSSVPSYAVIEDGTVTFYNRQGLLDRIR